MYSELLNRGLNYDTVGRGRHHIKRLRADELSIGTKIAIVGLIHVRVWPFAPLTNGQIRAIADTHVPIELPAVKSLPPCR